VRDSARCRFGIGERDTPVAWWCSDAEAVGRRLGAVGLFLRSRHPSMMLCSDGLYIPKGGRVGLLWVWVGG
jgi:hypothetical protein